MKKSKFLVLILSCNKNRYKHSLYSEYFKQKKINFLFIVGGSSTNKIKKNILYLNVNDDYFSLNKKITLALEIINKKYKNYSIFKIDDDTVINLDKIKNISFNFDYGGYIQENNFDNKKYKFAFGGGYFLSNKAIEIFCKNIKKYKNTKFFNLGEDKLVGLVLSMSKNLIKIVNLGKLINEDNKNMFVLLNNFLIHPVTNEFLKKYYNSKLKNFYYINPKGFMLPNPPVPP